MGCLKSQPWLGGSLGLSSNETVQLVFVLIFPVRIPPCAELHEDCDSKNGVGLVSSFFCGLLVQLNVRPSNIADISPAIECCTLLLTPSK